jgi:hypothetical protein
MKSVKIQLRLPEDLRDVAARQAAASGVSLNLFLATAVASRVGAQAEAERFFAARGARTTPQRAKALLKRLGTAGAVRDDDRIELESD